MLCCDQCEKKISLDDCVVIKATKGYSISSIYYLELCEDCANKLIKQLKKQMGEEI